MKAPPRTVLLHYLLGAWAMLTVLGWAAAGTAIKTGAALSQEVTFREAEATAGASSALDLRFAARQLGDVNFGWISTLKRLQINLAGVLVLVAVWPPRRPRSTCLPLIGAAALSAVLAWLILPKLMAMQSVYPYLDVRGPGRVDPDALNSLLSATLLAEVAKLVFLGLAIRFSTRKTDKEEAPAGRQP